MLPSEEFRHATTEDRHDSQDALWQVAYMLRRTQRQALRQVLPDERRRHEVASDHLCRHFVRALGVPGASATAMRFEDCSRAWLRSRKVTGQPISSVARQYQRPDRLGGAALGHRSGPRAVGLPRPRRAAGCHGSADRQRSGRSFGLEPDSMRSCSPSAHSSFSAPSGLPSRSPVVLRQRLNRRRLPAIRHSQPPVRR